MNKELFIAALVWLIAFATRVAAGHWIFTDIISQYVSITSNGFLLSESLLQGRGYSLGAQPSALHTPLYPLVIYLLRLVCDSGALLVAFHSAVGALTVLVVYMIGKELFSGRAGLVASAIFAVYPYQVRTDLRADRYALSMLLCAVSILLFIRLARYGKSRDAILTGVSLGISFLARETVLPFLLGTALYLVIGRKFRAVLVVAFFFCLISSVWWVRNYIVFGHVLLTRTDSGFTLYAHNNPHAISCAPDYNLHIASIPYIGATVPAAFHCEVDEDIYLKKEAVKFVFSRPLQYLKLCFLRLTAMLMPVRKPDRYVEHAYIVGSRYVVTERPDGARFLKNAVYFFDVRPCTDTRDRRAKGMQFAPADTCFHVACVCVLPCPDCWRELVQTIGGVPDYTVCGKSC